MSCRNCFASPLRQGPRRIGRLWLVLLGLGLLVFARPWGADALSPAPPIPPSAAASGESIGLAERVREHRLKNGMVVLVVERHQAPIVSINMVYRVGSVDEQGGLTGLAHFFEHMAFKGTRALGTLDYEKEQPILEEMEEVDAALRREVESGAEADPDRRDRIERLRQRFEKLEGEADGFVVSNEIGEIYDRHGAVGFNAGTGKDYTSYTVSLPANRLPLWAAIESDRMANTVLREFYKERNVVLEERRLRVDTRPSGKLYEAFLSTAFQAHPYRHPVIGWESDVASLTPSQAREFFATYYVPQNAVLAMVGDIQPKKIFRLVEKAFGQFPRQPSSRPNMTTEPVQNGERRVEVEFEANPRVMIGYQMPGIEHEDTFVLDVIDTILSTGRSSRLHTRLVKEKQVAISVSTSTNVPGGRYPGLFMISAVPRLPHTSAGVEEAVYLELDRLKKEPVGERELQRVLNQLDAYLIRSLSSNSGLARQLAYFETVAGDWRYLLRARERTAQITSEDVMRVARKYFTKRNRTVATLVRKVVEDGSADHE